MTSGFFKFFTSKAQRTQDRAPNAKTLRRGSLTPRRLLTEALEERQLLAVDAFAFSAAVDADSANVVEIAPADLSIDSIKQAILEAAATPEDDVIVLPAGKLTFADASDEIVVDIDSDSYGALVITADSDSQVEFDAAGLARVFSIKSGQVYLQGLTLTNGAADYGGAIANGGELGLDGVKISGSTATTAGGAIANKGVLLVQDCLISGNETTGNGAAIYEGDFDWPTPSGEDPEWTTIEDQVGAKGTTVTVDLSKYINEGDWTYSFEVADSTSSILAEAPTLNDGVLSFTFIGDEDYFAEDDYSALSVTVTAASGDASASTTFSVSLKEQTSATLAAVLSNMTYDDVDREYYVFERRIREGLASLDGVPAPTVVDVSNNVSLQVWVQDFASSRSGSDAAWNSGDYYIFAATYRLHLENATISAFTEKDDCYRDVYVHTNLDDGDYQFMVGYYGDMKFGYADAMMLDFLELQVIDPSLPVSATIYQDSTDWTSPTLQRMYSEPFADLGRSHLNVDPSQTLFVSTISNSAEPLSSIPGSAFDTNISRASLDSNAVEISNATTGEISTTISNSLIYGNTAGGNGVVYASEDATLYIYNATIADNVATGAAVYNAGTLTSTVAVANTIVVNANLAPATESITAVGNLFNASGWTGAVEYKNGALFTDSANGDYSLAAGSEAINIGDDAYALNVEGDLLSEDFAGNPRFCAAVDAGAYEYAGVAPVAPSRIVIADYETSDKNPRISWSASEGADGYYLYVINDGAETLLTSTTTRRYVSNLSTLMTLEDNATYTFGVAAYNAFGVSAMTTGVLDTAVLPSGDLTLTAGAYDVSNHSVELTWNAIDNATGYRVEQQTGEDSWTVVATVAETSYVATSLEDNAEYVYRVVSFNAKGDGPSASTSFTTDAAPAAPTNVAFGAYDSENKTATLSWTAVEGASGYSVQQYDAVTTAWVDVTRDDATATEYVLTDMVDFSTYVFRVAAYNDAGSSEWVEAEITASAAPAAPNNVAATFDSAEKSAAITWNFSVGATGGYNVYELVSGSWQKLATVNAETNDYTVADLALYTNYTFGVSAFNDDGESSVTRVKVSTIIAPEAPANLTVVDAESYAGDGAATIMWDAAAGADSYRVSVRVDGQTTVAGTTSDLTYTFEGLENYKDYQFVVESVNTVGVSDEATVDFSTLIVPTADLTVSADNYDFNNSTVKLTWNAVEYASGYRVEKSTDSTGWTVVASTDATEYEVGDLDDNTLYEFRVVSFNAKGDGTSATTSVFTLTPPAAPTDAAFGDFVAATGKATLSWTGVEYAAGDILETQVDGEWIVAEGYDDSSATEYVASGLESNTTYTYRVAATNMAGTSDYVVVILDTRTIDSAPAAPINFTVASYSESTHRATLTWEDVATNESGYEMQYSKDGETWTIAATLEADSTTRVANGLTPGQTYYFRIAAFNEAGYSDWAETSYDVPAEIPAAPTNLTFGEYDAENHEIVTSWTDASDNELGFKIQCSYNETDWFTVENVGANVTSRVATGLVEGRTYYFRVAAYNLYGVSDWAIGSVDIPITTSTAPAAPTDLAFSNVEFTSSGVQVQMDWTDNSNNEDRFVVQFSYDGESWYGAGTTDADVSTRVATGLVEGRTYHFRVAAYNSAGYSDWCEAEYNVPYAVVNPPSEIVFGEYSNGTLPMSWTDNSDDETGFVVQFSYDGENWHRGGTTEANVTERVATGMTPGRLYYFRVAAFNGSVYSDWTVGTYTTPSGAPAAPGDITFTGYDASARTVEMSWIDNSNDEVGFNVYYSVDGGDTWLSSGNTSADVASRTATGLRVGVKYEFRVRAFNAYGASGWSYGEFEVPVSDGSPNAPSDFVFGDYDAESKTLAMSWTDNADNETGFKVQYSVDGGETWYSAGNYGANVTSRVATSVVSGRSYTFRVAAYNNSGTSAWLVSDAYEVSNSVNIPTAPSDIAFGEYDSESRSVEMTWTDNSSNEKGFRVQYSVDDGQTWNDSAYLKADVTSRTATGIVSGRVYYFRVAAYNNYGTSDWATGSFSDMSTSDVAAPTDLAFNYVLRKRTIELTWNGAAASYDVQYAASTDSSSWYALTPAGTTATLSNVVDGLSYNFRVRSVAEDGSLSAWTEGTYDTASAAVLDDVDLIAASILDSDDDSTIDEFFKDYFDDLA